MGSSFWKETDYRIKELTTTVEQNLKASIGADVEGLSSGIGAARKLHETQRQDIANRAQQVVNEVQIRELSDVLSMLNDVLEDPLKRYYIVIDRLDENWIDDRLRFLLIRALIETVRDFRRVQNIKIVVALRYDLLDRVFRLTRDAGFQEEKYEALYLHVPWSADQLKELLDRRVGAMVRRRYTKKPVAASDLLPTSVNGNTGLDYVLMRTFMRPRDVIQFFNHAIDQAVDSPKITGAMLRDAEGEYSRGRLRAIADEWAGDYPDLMRHLAILKGRPSHMELRELATDTLVDHALSIAVSMPEKPDELSNECFAVTEGTSTPEELRKALTVVLYRVGLAGIKLETFEAVSWSTTGRRSVSAAELTGSAHMYIHPAFWRALGIVPAATAATKMTRP